jgi:hypothetical protein
MHLALLHHKPIVDPASTPFNVWQPDGEKRVRTVETVIEVNERIGGPKLSIARTRLQPV